MKTPKRCVLCFSILCLATAVLLIPAVIIWLTIKPKTPTFSVESATLLRRNSSGAGAAMDVVIRTYNPNKGVSISYKRMWVFVYYKGNTLGYNSMDPFVHPKKNETRVRVRTEVAAAEAAEVAAAVEVEVEVYVWGRSVWDGGGGRKGMYMVEAACHHVRVNVSTSGSPKRDCEVHMWSNGP